MNIFFLEDEDNCNVDAVIISEESTEKEIQEAIMQVKRNYPGEYTWDDLVEGLPSDCKIYDRWNDCGFVYY